MIVVDNVKAGETLDLSKLHKSNRVVYETNYPDDVFYEMVQSNRSDESERSDLKAALTIGLNTANKYRNQGQVLICGVVPDYEKTASDKCREISIGCLYATAKQEGNNAAN